MFIKGRQNNIQISYDMNYQWESMISNPEQEINVTDKDLLKIL